MTLADVERVLVEAESGAFATGGRDFGRGVAHLAKLIREALGPEDEPQYRYRIMGRREADNSDNVVVLENWAPDEHEAQSMAAFNCRWGWTAWPERQLIVHYEEPPWERI